TTRRLVGATLRATSRLVGATIRTTRRLVRATIRTTRRLVRATIRTIVIILERRRHLVEDLRWTVLLPDDDLGNEGIVRGLQLPVVQGFEAGVLHLDPRGFDRVEGGLGVHARRHLLPHPERQGCRRLPVEELWIDLQRALTLTPAADLVGVVSLDDVAGPDHVIVDQNFSKALSRRFLSIEPVHDPEVQGVTLCVWIDLDGLGRGSVVSWIGSAREGEQPQSTRAVHRLVLRGDGLGALMAGSIRDDARDLALLGVFKARGEGITHIAGCGRRELTEPAAVDQQVRLEVVALRIGDHLV